MRRHEKFTPDEDAKLKALSSEAPRPDWFTLAQQLPGRSARQCKDRWQKYLSPDIKRCAWTPAEDGVLRERYDEFGPKWARIAAFLPNRTDYMMKNRFAQLVRREHKGTKGSGKSSKGGPKVMSASVEPAGGDCGMKETGMLEADPLLEFPTDYEGCGCDLQFADDFWP
jgi:hypothetical protein